MVVGECCWQRLIYYHFGTSSYLSVRQSGVCMLEERCWLYRNRRLNRWRLVKLNFDVPFSDCTGANPSEQGYGCCWWQCQQWAWSVCQQVLASVALSLYALWHRAALGEWIFFFFNFQFKRNKKEKKRKRKRKRKVSGNAFAPLPYLTTPNPPGSPSPLSNLPAITKSTLYIV